MNEDDSSDGCIAERLQNLRCNKETVDDYQMCEEHIIEYIRELDACTIHLYICEQHGQVDHTQLKLVERVGDILEEQGIPAKQHADRVHNIFKNNPEHIALKRIETEQNAFLSEILPEYEATY